MWFSEGQISQHPVVEEDEKCIKVNARREYYFQSRELESCLLHSYHTYLKLTVAIPVRLFICLWIETTTNPF
jgi:hypothetical protein